MNILNLEYNRLEELIISEGFERFRAGQIFGWCSKGVTDFGEMKNIPKRMAEALIERNIMAALPGVRDMRRSAKDGTVKCLMVMEDGACVESVFMKYSYGNSICISSQAGCRMGCVFCASGLKGLERDLTPGEMYGQILAMEKAVGERISHIVVMGTGEPFDNYDNLSAFIRIMNSTKGRNLGMRNITVSTCGLIPMIERFGNDFPQVNLAVSLHAVNDTERSMIMPVNRSYPLKELLKAVRAYTERTARRVTFEFTLISGVNDDEEHAKELASLLRGMLCHVNLIPLNEVREKNFRGSDTERAFRFREILEDRGIPATVRRELGGDIDAACGQLRLSAADSVND